MSKTYRRPRPMQNPTLNWVNGIGDRDVLSHHHIEVKVDARSGLLGRVGIKTVGTIRPNISKARRTGDKIALREEFLQEATTEAEVN